MRLWKKFAFIGLCMALLSLPQAVAADDCFTCVQGEGCTWSGCSNDCDNWIELVCPDYCRPEGFSYSCWGGGSSYSGHCTCSGIEM